MKRLLLFVLFFFALGALGYWYAGTDSFVMLRIGEWVIQVQLLTGLLALIVFLWLLNALLFFVDQVLGGRLFARLRKTRAARRQRKGILELISGRPKRAKEEFLKAANIDSDANLDRLLACRSAIEAGQYDRALNILNNLPAHEAELDGPVRILRARVMFHLNRLDEAEEYCAEARRVGIRESQLGSLPLLIAEKRRDWKTYDRVAPGLRSLGELAAVIADIDLRVFMGRLSDRRLTAEELERIRLVMPPALRENPLVVEDLVAALVRVGEAGEAEKMLRESLHARWQPELLKDYIAIPAEDRERQLTQLEKWRHRHGDSPEILAALEQLNDESGNWQAAQDYSRERQNIEVSSAS